METSTDKSLHIADGINFDCSGCGNCCFEWPVPLTKRDFEKISVFADEEKIDSRSLFRVLASNRENEKLVTFTHSLEKREDGSCQFLTSDNRCRLHQQRGSQSKPAMCQLFPYTFTSTPSGVFASVSFASTGVILNSGRPLRDQREHLGQQLDLFQSLFPGLELDWSGIQLIDGVPISWQSYIEKEEPIVAKLAGCAGSSRVDRILFEAGEIFRKMAPPSAKLDNLANLAVRPKIIDQVLLKELLTLYFPEQVFSLTVCDLEARSIMATVLEEPERVSIKFNDRQFGVDQLNKFRLGRLPIEQEDILRRFLLCRVFSKLFFGPGFNYMSVVAGLHHLCLLISLLRIRLKLSLLAAGQNPEEAGDALFSRLVEEVRVLERRLTVASFSSESTAMLEVLLSSPQRIERFLSLSA